MKTTSKKYRRPPATATVLAVHLPDGSNHLKAFRDRDIAVRWLRSLDRRLRFNSRGKQVMTPHNVAIADRVGAHIVEMELFTETDVKHVNVRSYIDIMGKRVVSLTPASSEELRDFSYWPQEQTVEVLPRRTTTG